MYPCEIVKLVLRTNTAKVILAHNHPSGNYQPGEADKQITHKINQALNLIDVHVLDHIIVGEETFTMAEHGLM